MPDLALAGGTGHQPEPLADSAYSAEGPNTGLLADLRRMNHYPVEALCSGCGGMIRLERYLLIGPEGDWRHTGRRPGE